MDFRSLPIGSKVRTAPNFRHDCARDAVWLGFIGNDAFIWWPEGDGWRLNLRYSLDFLLHSRLVALGLDPLREGCWCVSPEEDILEVLDSKSPSAPRYPNDCPCGMPARICDYHKDA